MTSSWAAQKNAAALLASQGAAVASLSLCGPHAGGPQRIAGFHNRGKLPMARALYNNTQATGTGTGPAANKNNRRNRKRYNRNKNQKKPATSKPNSNKSNSTNDSNVTTDEVLEDSHPDNASQENTTTSNSSAAASPIKILAAGSKIDSISDEVLAIKLSGDDENDDNDDEQSLASPELQNGLVISTF